LGVNIRVTNVSDFDLENISIFTAPFETIDFLTVENLSSGETPEYERFTEIYPNPGATALANGKTLYRIGLISETDVPLIEGDFTCFIDVVENINQENRLSIIFVEDD